MKTHELGRALIELARALQAGPSLDLKDIVLQSATTARQTSTTNIAVNLDTLIDLARIDKSQWLAFIQENAFPIEARPRDASRDILGKVLRYLEENADARAKLKENVIRKTGQASPELMKALSFLLRDSHDPAHKRD